MLYEDAMAIVDAGGKVIREAQWTMSQAGFAWGPWVARERKWTDADAERDRLRSEVGDWSAPPIAPSGVYYRALHTLCESFALGPDAKDVWADTTDWIDVTDRFVQGSPKGYIEYMRGTM